jgi:hypothetical protein
MKKPIHAWTRYAAMSLVMALRAASAVSAQPQSETSAAGQPPADLLTALQQKTALGDTLRVVMNDGTEQKGILTDVSATSLTLIVKGKREVMAEAATLRVVRENPDSLCNGARTGAIVSAAVIAASLVASSREVTDPNTLAAVVIYAGVGAAIGTGIDALIKDHTLVYERPAARRASISVAPLLAPRQAGVRMTIVW